ncbi:hypothetical protein M407DRAFT_231267 [Tulasnella calospora MUT 4182]|uniref:F-box domain-containing protein n=1 Tax=Tulasnella calospora MUT 4182 TaxID=1051891 RepID=A0A0C3QMG9_9AGAM|nr:hypothetical protein M407DRAFT_231267 [Tulasnella calospora MUT 4182]
MSASTPSASTRQSPTWLSHKLPHTSSVTRAFGIDEIIRLILNFLSERRDLRNTLLVCKAFHTPALDRLWEVIPNLSPLLRILPQDAIDFMVEKSHQGKLVYKHKLLNGRARRVLKLYCRRIKQISALDLRDVDMRTVRAFVGCLGLPLTVGSQRRRVSDDLPCLFPNLARLAISIDPLKPSHGDLLAHLFSPKLEELSIQSNPLHPLLGKWAFANSDGRFSTAGPSRVVSTPKKVTMDTITKELEARLESRNQPAKFHPLVQKAMEPEAPIRRRSKTAKPISSTDDTEDSELAPAFGQKAYAAAVIMSSPLHTMTIDISESTDGGIMQLESLCAIPTLRDARVKGDFAPPTQAYAVLRYLGANPALEHLSSAPTARLASTFNAIESPGASIGEDGWFPALKSFQGYNDSLTRIIASSSGCLSNLTKIHITFRANDLQLDENSNPLSQRLQIQRFFDSVGSRCHALEDVTFTAFWDMDGQEGPISLRELSSCSQMRRLVFDGPDPAMNPPTDTDIIAMAEAWPLLEVLHWQGAVVSRDGPEDHIMWRGYTSIPQQYSSDTRPNATLKSLAKLSQLCQHLKEVEIDVNCHDELGSDDLVEPLPDLERVSVWRWNLASSDVARTSSVIATLAGPWKLESTLGKARDWITGVALRNGSQKTKLWEEVFGRVDELRGVPDELREVDQSEEN